MPGFEPGPHWWEVTTLTTAPSLAPPPLLFHSVVPVQIYKILLIYKVVVQFCPWSKFYFLLFQTHYHTLSYLKTKKNKI